MKILNTILIAIILFMAAMLFNSSSVENVEARRARRYLWMQSFPITNSPIDTLLPTSWEEVTFITRDYNAHIRVSGDDTSGFSSNPNYYLKAAQAINFGPADRVRRLYVVSENATDTLYALGYKSVTPSY